MHLSGLLAVSLGQATDAGVKEANEDSLGIRVPEGELLTTKGIVAVIADGVSSAEAGKEASETCVSNFLSDYYSTPDSWSVKKSAQQILTSLNRWLYSQSQQFVETRRGFISTFSSIVIKSQQAHIFHIGDSRIYRLRGSNWEQLTRDHCAQVTAEQAYLTRAMGMDVMIDIDYRSVDVEQGDIFFLSTDGIHDFVSELVLKQACESNPEQYEQTCQQLTKTALENGSEDNLSCQIVRIDALPSAQSDDVYRKLSDLPFPPFLSPGLIIDGYKIIEEIHASNRSQLYLVQDRESDQQLVMKTPSVNFEDDPAYIERFIMEAWVGQRIDSPHVVNVVGADRPKKFLYYLTEFVGRESLGDWVAKNNKADTKADVKEVVRIIEQVAKGLRAFHRKETLHQDLKPENIMLTKEGVPKIIDFGSCYVAGIHEIAAPFERDIALGTVHYSAPEYKVGKKAGIQADIFSLAAITYEMLSGKHPYGDKYERCQNTQDFSRIEYRSSLEFNPMVPVWMDGALKKALSITTDLRHMDLSEFIYDINNPNASFSSEIRQPWIERNPVRFWQSVSGVLFLTCLVLLTKLV